jgi:ribosomal protein S18 acetylase RimI-like enzyme
VLQECDSQNPDLAPFLEEVIWGTEGALYQLRDCRDTLNHLPQSRFLTWTENNRLIALRMFIEKHPRRGEQTLHAFYHSMFSVLPSEKGKGHGRRLANATLERLQPQLTSKGLIYSHVETDNHRSLHIHQALGYRRIGQFYAMSFSRLAPARSSGITALGPDDKETMVALLNRRYFDHALTDFAESLDIENYFVLRKGDEIVAGVQALPQRWVIRSLGGVGGVMAIHVLPYIPLIRRLINPKNFRFLKFGHLYFKEGQAKAVQELLEGLLARESLCTAMMFLDSRSPIFKEFSSEVPLGFLNTMTQTPVEIMGLFHHFSEDEIADLSQRPACISPNDL